MRTAISLLIFTAIVVVIALTIAPPVAGQTLPAADHPFRVRAVETLHLRAPVRPAIDLSGTYVGTVSPDGGQSDNGVIVVGRRNGLLNAAAGPHAEQLIRAQKVEQVGDVIRFELVPPDEVPRTIAFELKIEGEKMSGTATMTRDGVEIARARLDFAKQ